MQQGSKYDHRYAVTSYWIEMSLRVWIITPSINVPDLQLLAYNCLIIRTLMSLSRQKISWFYWFFLTLIKKTLLMNREWLVNGKCGLICLGRWIGMNWSIYCHVPQGGVFSKPTLRRTPAEKLLPVNKLDLTRLLAILITETTGLGHHWLRRKSLKHVNLDLVDYRHVNHPPWHSTVNTARMLFIHLSLFLSIVTCTS